MTEFSSAPDRFTRRQALTGGSCALAALALPASRARALAPTVAESHGLSLFGDLAMPADFKAFGYVRPDAPKGGALTQEAFGTFNSLNGLILKGDAASAIEIIFDTLMTGSLDEPDALYGLVAKSVAVSADKRTYRFVLRREARFHDGSPLTAKDVVFSLLTIRDKGHIALRQALRDLESAVAEAPDIVVVKLAENHSREAPLIVARQPILSSAWYASHNFEETTLEPPLGSGPYKVGRFEQGRFIIYDRVADYWGKDLPVNVGQNNFDAIRFDYFGDRATGFEAFKAGQVNLHESFTAAEWATGYDFPAMREGKIKRSEIPDAKISGIQGWFFNTRRDKFKDPRVREAVGLCFDFEWTNKNLMYGSYRRTQSFFENSDMKAAGAPSPEELKLLEPFRDRLPAEVFGEPFLPPVSDGSGQDRALLSRANQLLQAAGCARDGAILKGPDGKPLEFEFLDFSNALERHTAPFIKNLRLLGIDARYRVVDSAQYKERLDNFDFDIFSDRLVMSQSPGEELRALFGSQTAELKGSRNRAGIADPAIDALIAKALVAQSRPELVAICRALDRVLRAERYWVAHWYKPTHWIAHWDMFGAPERAPKFDPGVASTWWRDEAKAKGR